MKTKFLSSISILLVLTSCSTDSNSNGNNISTLEINKLISINSNIPQDDYDDLTFTNETTGYAVSRTGKIVKTTDGGVNWVILASNATFPLRKIQFINQNVGYVIGGNDSGSYLLKTTNSGQSWVITNLNSELNGCPNALYFKNENEGYITGNHLFIKTTDGGLTWSNVFSTSDENYQDVRFNSNQTIGYLTLNNGNFYKTINGGQSWQSIDSNNHDNHFKQVIFTMTRTYFRNNNTLIDIETNQSITLPNPVNKLLYVNNNKCIGIGQHYQTGFFPYGDIVLTNDNWNTFQQKTYEPSSEAMDFTAVAKMSNHKAMIIGNGQLETKIITISY